MNSMANWVAAYAVGAAYSGLPVSDVTSELRSAGFDEHVLDTAREAIRELRLVEASVRRSAMSLITHAAAS